MGSKIFDIKNTEDFNSALNNSEILDTDSIYFKLHQGVYDIEVPNNTIRAKKIIIIGLGVVKIRNNMSPESTGYSSYNWFVFENCIELKIENIEFENMFYSEDFSNSVFYIGNANMESSDINYIKASQLNLDNAYNEAYTTSNMTKEISVIRIDRCTFRDIGGKSILESYQSKRHVIYINKCSFYKSVIDTSGSKVFLTDNEFDQTCYVFNTNQFVENIAKELVVYSENCICQGNKINILTNINGAVVTDNEITGGSISFSKTVTGCVFQNNTIQNIKQFGYSYLYKSVFSGNMIIDSENTSSTIKLDNSIMVGNVYFNNKANLGIEAIANPYSGNKSVYDSSKNLF